MTNQNAKIKIIAKRYLHFDFSRGFTLLEIILVIGIFTLIGAITLVSFISSRNVRELTSATQQALSVIRLAQSKTLGAEQNAQWSVHLEPNQLVLFQGPTYAGSPSTRAYALHSSIEIANTALAGGGTDIVFKRITGGTSQSGMFDVRVKSTTSSVRGITVDASGNVFETGTVPAAGAARIIDARHRSFALGWSIKTSTNLTFTFFDPPSADTVTNIAMASYFDAGKTKFDWSGVVTIGGQNQSMRIHTTMVSDTDTALSIDRDCRKNTKKVRISIDGADIATYEADCRTITVHAAGGSMTEP